jgi:hypothetical protein
MNKVLLDHDGLWHQLGLADFLAHGNNTNVAQQHFLQQVLHTQDDSNALPHLLLACNTVQLHTISLFCCSQCGLTEGDHGDHAHTRCATMDKINPVCSGCSLPARLITN